MGARLQETTFADGTDAVLAALDADGGVIVHDFISADVLTELRADMQAAAEGQHFGTVSSNENIQGFWGAKTMRFTRLASRSRAFLDVLTHEGFLDIADQLLLPSCKSYWMNTGQMMILAPGQPAQDLHRDGENWWRVLSPTGFEVTISCMFPLEDFTIENGATHVVPGSHRWDDYERQAQPDEVTQAVMPAGSGMLYTGRVLHGGGANTSEAWRWGLHVSFVVGWLTPEEASPLGTPWDVVRDQPERVQQLLGWRCGADGGRVWTVDYEDIPEALGLT